MPVTAEKVVVELLAKVDGYAPAIEAAANRAERALDRDTRAAADAERGISKAHQGAARNAEGASSRRVSATQRAASAVIAASGREISATEAAAQRVVSGSNSMTQSLARLERQADVTGRTTEQSFAVIQGGASRVGGIVAATLGGIGAIAAAKEFLEIADAAKQIDAQLSLTTASFGSFAQAQEDVKRISADARVGLADTVSLYGSFNRSAQEIGRSQTQAAQATDTFTKALKIGGAGTQQVQSATLQMGQALRVRRKPLLEGRIGITHGTLGVLPLVLGTTHPLLGTNRPPDAHGDVLA